MKATQIPTKSRDAVQQRENGRCARCGGQGAHWHHRRSRSVRDALTHNPANGVLLCTVDHAFVHAHPKKAMEEGFIVSRYFSPDEISFRRWDGRWILPDTEGGFSILSEPDDTVNGYEIEKEQQP